MKFVFENYDFLLKFDFLTLTLANGLSVDHWPLNRFFLNSSWTRFRYEEILNVLDRDHLSALAISYCASAGVNSF